MANKWWLESSPGSCPAVRCKRCNWPSGCHGTCTQPSKSLGCSRGIYLVSRVWSGTTAEPGMTSHRSPYKQLNLHPADQCKHLALVTGSRAARLATRTWSGTPQVSYLYTFAHVAVLVGGQDAELPATAREPQAVPRDCIVPPEPIGHADTACARIACKHTAHSTRLCRNRSIGPVALS